MAELITGRGGTDHVDSEDFGAFNAVTLGDGTYILSGCSMAMKTATTLHIAAGELLMQGRHVRIKGAGEDIDVAVGTTGYNRNDLVALHYKQEGGIESVSVEVVPGTPTTGAASDPELGGGSILNGDAEAYVAIARVPIVGLAPSEPVVLVGGLKSNSQLAESISALGDSVYQTKKFYLNSPCMTARAGCKAPAQLNVCGNICTLFVNGMTTRTIRNFTELVDSDGLVTIGEYLSPEFDSEQQRNTTDNTGVVGCRLYGGSDAHLWLVKDFIEAGSEMRFVFTWAR